MYYKHGKTTFYYEKQGNKKRSIVILPGWGNTRNTFQNMIDNLKENFTIYCIDYPGFGKSPPFQKEKTIYDYAEIIKDFLESLSITNPIIIAHSFGGRITAILQGKYNIPIQKIILIDVAGIKRHKSIKLWLKEKIYKILKKGTQILHNKKLEEKLRTTFSSNDYKELSPNMRKTFQNIIQEDLSSYYKKTTSDVLILWGEQDQDTPLKDAYYLNKNIKNSALIIFQKAGHFAYLDYPFLTNKILDSYLKKED